MSTAALEQRIHRGLTAGRNLRREHRLVIDALIVVALVVLLLVNG